jgi:hypothetical protein
VGSREEKGTWAHPKSDFQGAISAEASGLSLAGPLS